MANAVVRSFRVTHIVRENLHKTKPSPPPLPLPMEPKSHHLRQLVSVSASILHPSGLFGSPSRGIPARMAIAPPSPVHVCADVQEKYARPYPPVASTVFFALKRWMLPSFCGGREETYTNHTILFTRHKFYNVWPRGWDEECAKYTVETGLLLAVACWSFLTRPTNPPSLPRSRPFFRGHVAANDTATTSAFLALSLSLSLSLSPSLFPLPLSLSHLHAHGDYTHALPVGRHEQVRREVLNKVAGVDTRTGTGTGTGTGSRTTTATSSSSRAAAARQDTT